MPMKTGSHILMPVAGFALALSGSAFAADQSESTLEPSAGATAEPLPSDDNAMDPLDENFEQQTEGTAFFDWTLDDFVGASVVEPGGAFVGTVSNVVRDDGDDVYLVVSLTGETGGHVVPFEMFGPDGSIGSLVLEGAAPTTVGTMAMYEEHMDAYPDVENDTRLFELLNPSGMERDE